MSNRDSFWGAKPNQGETTLIGINILRQLLTSLRDELRRQKGYTGETVTRYLTGVKTNTLVINGKTVIGKDSEWSVNFLMVAHGWAYHRRKRGYLSMPTIGRTINRRRKIRRTEGGYSRCSKST